MNTMAPPAKNNRDGNAAHGSAQPQPGSEFHALSTRMPLDFRKGVKEEVPVVPGHITGPANIVVTEEAVLAGLKKIEAAKAGSK